MNSVALLAEISLRSPRKLFILIIKQNMYRIKCIQKMNHLILKKTSLSMNACWLVLREIYTIPAKDVGHAAQAINRNSKAVQCWVPKAEHIHTAAAVIKQPHTGTTLTLNPTTLKQASSNMFDKLEVSGARRDTTTFTENGINHSKGMQIANQLRHAACIPYDCSVFTQK